MAIVVAGASLMANGDVKSAILTAAVRFATWILPPHRKDWARAMLNEMAYVGSRRAAWCWMLGCTLFAIRERASFELMRPFTARRMLKVFIGLSAASVIGMVGVYTIQKPYQRERILITVFHRVGTTVTRHIGTVQ
ncbi:hypothetical protein [Dyella caseinilytica]|uniref:Uncharacterized protein n=1 Tax=Dyella caseinilytica TaxID=1849581 RepID=A0ABX7GV19_9GAMM|nr:hypothetical protein [Dyella caseinilytica]QRN54295.1 hypothetical protein ISN74_02580 [Dyella caseinilytica]